MPTQVVKPTVRAEFHGDVSGQVAIGDNNLQINQMFGGVVYHLAGGQTAVPRPIPTPVYLRPRRFPGLLDRQVERQTAQATTQKALPVQFYSDSGWGKTSLLRYLAYHLDDSLYPDGIVYQRVAGMGLDDIRQVLFDLFYEADIPIKPLPGQITRYLQQKQALILLDDITLPREDMEELMDTAPRCTFLFASPENTIWHEGKAIQVKGLPEEEALQLLEDELSRPLSAEEAQAARIIVGAIQGNPLKLRQLAALMRDKDLSLVRIAAGLTTPENATALDDQKLTAFAVRSLPKDQRKVALG
ncbi:MAG TPA: hypothetical protein ENK32_06975, partial [Anaerolineae bacterium]|nr:hypothetical protein [Anaerolineae bacterium]